MINVQSTYQGCPVCNSKSIINIIKNIEPKGDLTKEWVLTHKNRSFFPYNVCENCSLLYVNKYFNEEDLSILYNKLDNNLYSGSLKAHQKTQFGYQKILSKFYRNKQKPSKIMEFGPDMGILSNSVSKAFEPTKYYLIEPNKKLHKNLKKITNSKIYDKFEAIDDIKDNSLDLIIMVHVFDHILNPKKVLLSLKNKLKKTGSVFLVTHNTSSLLRFILKQKWPPFCMHHPQLYNEKSIIKLFNICKFQSVETFQTYNYFKLSSYVNSALSILNLKTNFEFGPILKMPVGNMATIGKK